MKKEILITLLCAGLLLITPLTSVAQENKVSSNLIDEPDIEGLFVQLKDIINEMLQKYGHIFIVANLCNMILNSLGLLGNIIICILLIILMIIIALLIPVFILAGLSPYLYFIAEIALLQVASYFCIPHNSLISNLPLKSLFTLSEIKDITNTFDDCPCLQE